MKVLDKGFVEVVQHWGGDLMTVNAARVSFGKKKDELDEKDEKLIKYLAEHKHQSPFRHSGVTFHIKLPIFVMRQWVKHRIAVEINEISGRYVEFSDSDFYVPMLFRRQAKVNKQGSEGFITDQEQMTAYYLHSCRESFAMYSLLLSQGVCKEQARMVLPLSLYTEAYITMSLEAIAHFVTLRTHEGAQWEIVQYANVLKQITSELFPVSFNTLVGEKSGNLGCDRAI